MKLLTNIVVIGVAVFVVVAAIGIFAAVVLAEMNNPL